MRETDLSQRGALQIESLVEYIDEFWDGEIADSFQRH